MQELKAILSRPQHKHMVPAILVGMGFGLIIHLLIQNYIRCQQLRKKVQQIIKKKQQIQEELRAQEIERDNWRYSRNGKYSGQTIRKWRVIARNITYNKTIDFSNSSCLPQFNPIQWQNS